MGQELLCSEIHSKMAFRSKLIPLRLMRGFTINSCVMGQRKLSGMSSVRKVMFVFCIECSERFDECCDCEFMKHFVGPPELEVQRRRGSEDKR